RRGADLLVAVRREVLGEEVDEPALLLEHGEETERVVGRRRLGRRGDGRGRRGPRKRHGEEQGEHERPADEPRDTRDARERVGAGRVREGPVVAAGDRRGGEQGDQERLRHDALSGITGPEVGKSRLARTAPARKNRLPMSALERYARFLVRHAVAVLVLVALATAALLGGLGRLRADFDVEGSLPANHPFVQIDRRIRAQFGGRNTMIVAIVPRDGDVWRPSVLRIVHDVTLEAIRLPDVIAQDVVSLAAPSVRHVEDRGGAIETDYLMRDVPETPEEIARLRT